MNSLQRRQSLLIKMGGYFSKEKGPVSEKSGNCVVKCPSSKPRLHKTLSQY